MIFEVLEILKEKDTAVSGANIAKELGVSRTAVWKQIQRLRAAGYDISGQSRVGYRLKTEPDKLWREELEKELPPEFSGRVICLDEVESTNNLAKELAAGSRFKPVGLIVADKQTGGRGRFQRVWASPKGGIWMSLVVRPGISAVDASKMAPLAAVIVAEVIIETSGLPARIKWPNDILINDKKVCGILTEMAAEVERVEYLVIGIGLNANFDAKTIRGFSATTIKSELGRAVNRVELISKIASRLSKELPLLTAGYERIAARWKALSITLGKDVQISSAERVFKGRAIDIDSDGALIVELPSGERRTVRAGDVSP